MQSFIRNHQYNLIKKQAGLLQQACGTVADRKVVESVRSSVRTRVIEAFPDATGLQIDVLEKITAIHTAEDAKQYLNSLEPYLEELALGTENELKKLFPKIKKLRLPDLAVVDFRSISYLGWTDLASNRLYVIYKLDGKLIGIEGRYTPTNKKSTCFVCNRQEEVALFTAITKKRPAHSSPDYYKAIGNYLCVDSEVCNRNITSVTSLEKFIQDVMG